MQIVVLQNVLEGLRYFSVDSVIELAALLLDESSLLAAIVELGRVCFMDSCSLPSSLTLVAALD